MKKEAWPPAGTMKYPKHAAEYLEARDILEAAKAAGVVYVTEEQAEELKVVPEDGQPSDGLAIPGGKKGSVRFLRPGARPKIKSCFGNKNSFYEGVFPEGSKYRWNRIRDDTSVPLHIVEGPLKALACTWQDIPALGINGVWGWSSDHDVIEDIDSYEWEGRTVVLCFDSDIVQKGQVRQALKRLSTKLGERGAKVLVKLLPSPHGKNVGADDYLKAHGAKAFHKLPTVPISDPRFDGWDAPVAVQELNERLAFVKINGSASILCEYDDPEYPGTRDFTLSTERDMRFEYANQCVEVTEETGGFSKRSAKTRSVSKFEIWRMSPHRRSVRRLVLLPGKPPGRDPQTGDFNIWQGWGVVPHEPDNEHSWALMQEHVRSVLADGNDDYADFILNWSAYCVQRPDRIPETSIAFLGPEGCGKGMFCRSMVRIHGRHGVQLMSPDELVGRFNGRLKDKLMIFADEAFFAGDPKSNGVLKGMLTEPRVKVEDKFRDAYDIPNYRKLLIASNEDWVVAAGPSARRYPVFRVNTRRMEDHKYFKDLRHQMEHGGYGAMLWDLLHRDISGFNPRAIPKTRELFEQKKLGFDPITQWWFEKLQDADGTWSKGALTMTRKQVYADVSEYTVGHYDKRALQTKIGMKLRQLCPAVRLIRVSEKDTDTRSRQYLFPERERCRAAFEKFAGQEINWSSGMARKTPRNGDAQ